MPTVNARALEASLSVPGVSVKITPIPPGVWQAKFSFPPTTAALANITLGALSTLPASLQVAYGGRALGSTRVLLASQKHLGSGEPGRQRQRLKASVVPIVARPRATRAASPVLTAGNPALYLATVVLDDDRLERTGTGPLHDNKCVPEVGFAEPGPVPAMLTYFLKLRFLTGLWYSQSH